MNLDPKSRYDSTYELYKARRSDEYYIVITSDSETALYRQTKWNEEQKKEFGSVAIKHLSTAISKNKKLRYEIYVSEGRTKRVYKIKIYEIHFLDVFLRDIYFIRESEEKK